MLSLCLRRIQQNVSVLVVEFEAGPENSVTKRVNNSRDRVGCVVLRVDSVYDYVFWYLQDFLIL